MPKIPIENTPIDLRTDKNFSRLREVLNGQLGLDNMNVRIIEGTTASTADTERLFNHSMTPKPVGWFPLVGDIYVQSINDKTIDIRATKPEVNFKIYVIGGPQITQQELSAIGSSGYQTTTEVIQNTPVITIEEVLEPILFESSLGKQDGGTSYINGPNYTQLNDKYIFYTTHGEEDVYRLDRTTKLIEAVTVGSGQDAGPIYLFGNKLWCLEDDNDGSFFHLHEIDVTTWTVDNTYNMSENSVLPGNGSLYVEADPSTGVTTAYIGYRNATGIAKVAKYIPSTNSFTSINLSNQTNTFVGKIMADENYVYIVEQNNNSGGNNIFQLTRSTFAVDTTYDVPRNRREHRAAILFNDFIFMPGYSSSSMSSSGVSASYVAALDILDLTTGAWTEIGVPNAGGSRGAFLSNIAFDSENGYLYMIGVNGASGGASIGINIIRFDLVTEEFITGFFPFVTGGSGGGGTTKQLENLLLIDTDSNPLIISAHSGSGSDIGIQFFKPDFSKYNESLFT